MILWPVKYLWKAIHFLLWVVVKALGYWPQLAHLSGNILQDTVRYLVRRKKFMQVQNSYKYSISQSKESSQDVS